MSNRWQFVLLLMAAVAAASMWFYVERVMVPYQQADASAKQRPRGNLSDLYPRWLGTRELLLHHRDPYGADITREIQVGYYGRVLDSTRPNDPKDQQGFAYPLYAVFLLAPTIHLPFLTVQRIFFYLFVGITAGSVLLWLQALAWRISVTANITWILLTLGCFPAIQGFKLQQLTVLVAALIAAFLAALASRRFVLAGILLAIATIKPQLIALPALWLCIWVAGDWPRRRRALVSFAISTTLLVIAAEVLLPGWIHEFRSALAAYYQYTGGGKSVLDVALTTTWGRRTSAGFVVTFAVIAWRLRRSDEGTAAFQWTFALALAVTLAVVPMFAPYNQLLLLPAVMIIVRSIEGLWRKSRLTRFFVVITALAVFFPWIGAFLLVSSTFFLPPATVQRGWGLPFYPSLAIPLTILALLFVTRSMDGSQAANEHGRELEHLATDAASE